MPNVGNWITPNGQNITYSTNGPFEVEVGDVNDPGYLDIGLASGQQLQHEHQGVYTCQIPDKMRNLALLHIGIYLPTFVGKLQISLYLCTVSNTSTTYYHLDISIMYLLIYHGCSLLFKWSFYSLL